MNIEVAKAGMWIFKHQIYHVPFCYGDFFFLDLCSQVTFSIEAAYKSLLLCWDLQSLNPIMASTLTSNNLEHLFGWICQTQYSDCQGQFRILYTNCRHLRRYCTINVIVIILYFLLKHVALFIGLLSSLNMSCNPLLSDEQIAAAALVDMGSSQQSSWKKAGWRVSSGEWGSLLECIQPHA